MPSEACASASATSQSSIAWTCARAESCCATSGSSDIEKHRLVRSLQDEVEAVLRGAAARDQRRAPLARHAGQDRVLLVLRLALEVDARDEPAQEPAREDLHQQVRGLCAALG